MRLNIALACIGAMVCLVRCDVPVRKGDVVDVIENNHNKERSMHIEDYSNIEKEGKQADEEAKEDRKNDIKDEAMDESIKKMIDDLSKNAAQEFIKEAKENNTLDPNATEEDIEKLTKEMAEKILKDAGKSMDEEKEEVKEEPKEKTQEEKEEEESRSIIVFSEEAVISEEEMAKAEIKFELSSDKEKAASLGVPMPGIYYNSVKGEYKFNMKEKTASEINNKLKEVLALTKIPVFGEITKENSYAYEHLMTPIVYFISKKSEFGNYDWCAPIAESLKSKLVVTKLDYTETEFFLNAYGVNESMIPALFLISLKDNKKMYKYLLSNVEDNQQTVDFLTKCAEDIDSIPPYLMGQEKKSSEEMVSESGLTTIVTSTFDEVALNKEMNSLVVFYAEWCRFCQNLIPSLENLSSVVKSATEDVVIGKMLMSKNDVPLYDEIAAVNAYPTIRLYKKGTNEEVELEITDSPATAEGILEFLKLHKVVPQDLSLTAKKPEPTEKIPEEIKVDL